MKRLIFLLAIIGFLGQDSYATHLMGGEITASQLNGLTYEVTLTTYRDTIGIPMANDADFEVRDDSGSIVMNFSQQYDDTLSGQIMPGIPYGVENYFFIDTITLPGPGTYHISWSLCCRNEAIINMSQPGSENLYLETKVTAYPGASNSTPEFLAPPITHLPIHSPWQYNPLPSDPDGDSLVWSLDVPMDDHGGLTPVNGYNLPPSDSGGAFSINQQNGVVSWTASTLGNFVSSILVEEFRNGVKIGEIRRDMQMIVTPDSNNFARIMNMDQFSTNQNGNYGVNLPAGGSVQFKLLANDPDAQDNITFKAFGKPFLFDDNAATFDVKPTGNGNELEGTFTWSPTKDQARQKPYSLVFRTMDGEYAYDETVMLKVNKSTGIGQKHSSVSNIDVYPNPTRSFFTIPLELEDTKEVRITLHNISGQLVQQWDEGTLNAGKHKISKKLEVENGTYFLSVEENGVKAALKKIVVTQ